MNQLRYLILATTVFLLACNSNSQMAFDSAKWLQKDSTGYPFRDLMLNDLTTQHQLKGLTKQELIELLGRSENSWEIDKELFYPIVRRYDEPVHIKWLAIRLDSKSKVEHFEIVDNRKK